ncbi:tetratricopeptide repeat protein [Liquorilactobacillus uvarum]|uniref:tetratricopeptide repeat protein n=1 Tax=Liquorilactobacillus uvarum TaxID=303240 RepID=UPI0028899F7B|nr:tetratricopeptide repeat protein [Liquorilactobacillus uvarum]
MSYSAKVISMIEMGKFDDVETEFEKALQNDNADLVYSLAEELYSMGFSELAQKAYQFLLDEYPEEDQLRTALADIAISEGNNDEALDYLAAVKPNSDAYLNSLLVAADLYQTQGLFEVSEQKLLSALAIAPEEPILIFALAEFYFDIKKYHHALPLYLKLIKSGHTELSQVNITQRLGFSYAVIGKFEQALGYLEQVHEDDIDFDTRFQLAFTELQLKQYDEAIKNFTKLKKSSTDYTTVYPYLAEAYEQQGLLQQALEVLQEGLRVDQYNIKLYQLASSVALKLQQPKLAEKHLRSALALEPDNMTIVIQLSNLLVELKKYHENIELLTDYLQKDETDPQLYWNLGKSYAEIEDDKHALENYQVAARAFDNQPDFLREASFFYRKVGRLEDAKKFVDEYLELVPEDLEMLDLQDELQDL